MTTNINIEEDDEIIKRCLSGEIEVFRYLVEKYQIRVIIIDAEDVAQEVFLRAYDNLNNFKFDSKFYSWLYRIAVNTSLNYINSKEKRKEKETISDESCLNNSNTSSENPSDYYQMMELIDKVEPLFDNLPGDLKKLLELYEIYDYSYEEISKKLSVPIGTVRSRLHRARSMLISNFKDLYDE